MTTLAHTGPISSVDAYASYVATAGYDNRVILWNADTRTALSQGRHDHLVNHCEFSHDGRYLATASSDYSARIWEVPGMRLTCVLAGHQDDVDMASFSPDDQLIATCALDRVIRIFDIRGQLLKALHGHTGNIISVRWTDDGKKLVSSSVDGTVREWCVETGEQLVCHNMDAVRTDTTVFDSEGRILAGDDRGRIAIISGDSIQYVQAHQAGVKKLVYSNQRGILASLSYDRSLVIWKSDDAGDLSELIRTEIPEIIWSRAAAVLDDDRLVVGTFGTCYAVYDWTKNIWNVEGITAGNGINAVTIHQGKVLTVGDTGIVHADGLAIADTGSLCNFLLSAGSNVFTGGQLGQLFNACTGEVLHQHRSPINCGVYFIRDRSPHIAIGTYTGEVLVFKISDDGKISFLSELSVFDNAIKGLTTAGNRIFAVCASTDIAWIDNASLSVMNKIPHAHEKIVNACSVAGKDGFASVGRDRTLRLWMNDVQEIYQSPHKNSVKSLCVSADGKTLMTGSYGGTVAGFDLKTRSWTSFIRPTTAGISSIAYDEQNHCFLAAAYDGSLHVI